MSTLPDTRTIRMKGKSKLIVIDGIDGSGKATQSKLLAQKLRREGRSVRQVEFPQYDKNLFGGLIGEYLRGQFGDFTQMDPRLASVLYAGDRFETKHKIEKWFDEGAAVIADRYVSANQIHQGGKIKNARERKAFLKWLDKLEYGVFGLPRPDVTIYLDIPVALSLALLNASSQELKKKKQKYLKGKKDIVESNRRYLEQSRQSALLLAKAGSQWERVSCTDEKGSLLSPQTIHEHIWRVVIRRRV